VYAGAAIPVASWNQVRRTMTSPVQASTRDALLSLLLERGDADAADLAGALNLSVQAVRRQLKSLAEAGLAEASPSVSGPGRPSNRWRLTDQGRDQFPDGSQRFALGLLNSMRASLPEETVRTLLNQQAEDKASRYRDRIGNGSLQQRLEQLASLRRDEGYVTLCSPEEDGVSWRLQEVHCSVQRIAEEFPAVCDQELVLIRRTVPDCQVERVHWRLEGGHACGFRITPLQN
jgi:DeoR family suf operon transcriptional repressor|tara:strand:+ start:1630 stop:2325 length:696 start_codon:yes stop_codon:yes gene_type:complete